ncbi:MAG: DUF3854 domain-containing protein [Candidatus Riflebacteria bacterium]|nr:DUF3854 domain-containing protein [Candidatus Riflebacteria bacterium]
MNQPAHLKVVPKPITVDIDLYRPFWTGRDPSNGLVRLAVEDMVRSGILPGTLERNNVRLWNNGRDELMKSLGRTRIDGLEILPSCELAEFRNCDEHGTYKYSRFRLYPEVNGLKYLHPHGVPAMPWIPKTVWDVKSKNNAPIWITEGEKKALKLVQHGEHAISLPGVWNFKAGGKDRHSGWQDKELWGCLREFQLAGRTIYLAFDSDLWTNPSVRYALYELSIKLYALGSLVRIAIWHGGKGIDDHLVAAPFIENAIIAIKEGSRDLFSFIVPDHQSEVLRALAIIDLSPVMAEQLEAAVAKTLGISRHALRKEIRHRKDKDGVSDYLARLNERFALIHGFSEIWDCELAQSMKVEAFKHLLPFEGKRWLDSARKRVIRMENIVFEPAGAAETQINLFRSWPLPPDKNKPCDNIIKHLLHVAGDEASCHWLTCWLAWPLQNPGAKMATSIVVHGGQGTGKSILFETILKIYGEYGAVIDQKTLEADFTGWLSRKLFIIADEVISNFQQVQVKNRIKGLVTGGSVWVNRKGIEPREEANHVNLVFLSNEDLPLLIDQDDRRFFVIRCDQKEDGFYYKAIADEVANGGAAGLYRYLLDYDCSDFEGTHTKPPMTDAKHELARLCERTPEKFLRAWKDGEIPVNYMTARARQIFTLYCLWCSESNENAISETKFGKAISKVFPKKAIRIGAAYQVLKPITEMTQEDVDFFQEKLEAYRKLIVSTKAR